MNQWSPVEVVWLDAHGGDNGWEAAEDLPHEPFKVITVGILYKQDETGITVVSSRVEDSIGGYTFVPTINIVSVRALK